MRPAGRSGARRSPTGRRWSIRWWPAAAVLLLVVVACVTAVLRQAPVPAAALSAPPVAAPAGTPAAPSPTTASPTSAAPSRPAPRVPPVALRIPALGLAVDLSQLGLNPDRTVQVPTDFQQPGWFKLGPTPGQPGSAVILGHVDSYRGPAVFFRLRSLHTGDRVEVRLADGTVARFAVRAVRTYLKANFPARQVYATRGGRFLQLVTCGGEFDPAARSYLSNIVVYTELISAGGRS